MKLPARELLMACIALCAGNVTAQDAKKAGMEMSFVLKNNPAAKLHHVLPYKTFNWESGPELQVEVTLPQIVTEYDAIARVYNTDRQLIYTDTNHVTTKETSANTLFKLNAQLADPKELEVIINKNNKTLYRKNEVIDLVKLYGTVTGYDGKPVSGAWIVTLGNPFQIVTSNAKGEYTMYLPKGNYNSIVAMNDGYPKQTLENYIWNLPLRGDYKYDFKIGKAEVFRLMASAMPQNRIISGSFIGWTCSGATAWMDSKKAEKYAQDDSLFYDPYLPVLKKEHVKFYIDDILVNEVPLFERTDVLVYKNNVFNAGYKFEFLLPRGLSVKEYHTLKVEINYSTKESTIPEQGQGTLHNIEIY